MTAMQCDAAAIYDKRKDNLRFFLDNLPTHPCHMRPNFNLCTVCFKINQDIAKSCEVYLNFNRGFVESKVRDPLHVDLARSIDMASPEEEAEVPDGLEKEFPLFEFATPSVRKVIYDEEPEDEVIDAEVVEAEVVEEEPPRPVVKPVPKVTPPPKEAVKVKRVVKPVAKPLPPPPKPEEKKAPEAQIPAAPSKPVVKAIRKVKMVVKAAPPPTAPVTPRAFPEAPKPMPPGPPRPMVSQGIKDVSRAGPSPMPAPGPSPLEPNPGLFPPPPGPGPGPSPEPDDDDDDDTELIRSIGLEKKAPMRPVPPPPPKADARPGPPPAAPKPVAKAAVPPLFATLGKLETKKKPDE